MSYRSPQSAARQLSKADGCAHSPFAFAVVAAVEARFEVKRDAHAVEYARRKQNGGLSSAGIGDPLLPSYSDQPSMSSYRKSAGVGYYDS